MGIRVSKSIGYYLSKKAIKNLFVKDWMDILEEENPIDNKKIIEILKTREQLEECILPAYFYKHTLPETSYFYNFIEALYDYDNFKGVLLTDVMLNKNHRYNNTIDYYENYKEMKFKIKYINGCIYPNSNYICTSSYGKVDKGKVILEEHFQRLKKVDLEASKNFKPVFDYLIFVILQESGILKKDITYIDVINNIRAAIITEWR